ncbi:mitochondrial inner membrane protease subunit 1 [Toxorhynchites rutilus septentrionalis]|uniref:mitochondrial inner membrane protease subunit 1 n=1 Tax=Toxorhynchites rutilus septentrionalis TaxID=329112 RepID=UPI002479AD16|nr:mitochondrial inner membrane protease subunit 1 [Toxorhynchites rutilus septentrionalis]
MFKVLSKLAGICGYVVQYGCITHCTFEYLGDFVVCVGPSMEPTLHTNNVLLTDRISPRLNHLQRGDIIITKSPTNPMQHVCKRIVGVPGDTILTRVSYNLNPISNNYTTYTTVVPRSSSREVSGKQLKLRWKADFVSDSVRPGNDAPREVVPSSTVAEQTSEEPPRQEARTGVITVPKGHLWIEGDNVHNSSDSRNYGPVPIGLVKSRAVCRVWPPAEFKVLA